MEVLNDLYLTQMLHTISDALIIPVVVVLMLLIIYTLYSVGSVLVEVWVERRHYSAQVPELVAQLDVADFDDLPAIIDESGLLRSQKDDLEELVSYMYLPEDARTEVAKRLLANENEAYQKVLGRTEVIAKVAPMLGLMGTLIPLGPGIVALGTGDLETLSSALLVAFDTTVAGLACAVVCYVISHMRRKWYADYLVSMEAAFNTLLEKARLMHEFGMDFDRVVYSYDKAGRKATKRSVEESLAERLGTADAQGRSGVQTGHTPSAGQGMGVGNTRKGD